MKNIVIAAVLITLLNSCDTPSYYYQIYKTTSSENLVKKNEKLVFEDENCVVSYNLWTEGGNIGFTIYNKSNNNLHLNLEDSFFILNGYANNYFKNRVFSRSENSGTMVTSGVVASRFVTGLNNLNLLQTNNLSFNKNLGVMNSSGSSETYYEEKIIIIPPMSAKNIAEFTVTNTFYKDCDLKKYPTKRTTTSKNFTKSDSPFVFSNRISYFMEPTKKQVKFENNFYVSEITNYPKSEVIELKYDEECGRKTMYKSYYFKETAPDKFYLRYY